ncbi:MAG: methionine gamma-lyase family protein [Clostridiales Family XIII bacterium]|jgi:cystathionine beta-lyase family protein involved in aluminum resistance|nr:methionine gamma-lyase family protein [Clostridiales Family XIII bacterium]
MGQSEGRTVSTGVGINTDPRLVSLAGEAEAAVSHRFAALDALCEANTAKVLEAFRAHRLSEAHFASATGYGYGDTGRDVTEKVFAQVFGAESALVRTQIVSGTHAIALALYAVLRPGDKLLYCSGAPYDTIRSVIGLPSSSSSDNNKNTADTGTLRDFGIGYAEVDLTADGFFDFEAVGLALKDPSVKMAAVQRATGYGERPAITLAHIREWAAFVRSRRPDVVLFADNCYGEFLEAAEPADPSIGLDLCAGSLIKNPGGGLALSGGYVAGRADLVERAACRLTCPGIAGECGLTFGQTRAILQGLFLAPQTVTNALKGAILCAAVFERLGFSVFPGVDDDRSDIVEAVRLGSPEALAAFCEGVQAVSPVDSYVRPEPWDMPGYTDKVIMASGAFVSGSSIELSADGPLRPPYIAYFQGGLTYAHAKIGVLGAAQRLLDKGLIYL